MKKVNRRDFFKYFKPGKDHISIFEETDKAPDIDYGLAPLLLRRIRESPEVCNYCKQGCSFIVYFKEGNVVNIESDPDNPNSNEGFGGLPECEVFLSELRKKDGRHK